jgi:sialic acid synthase SpsE
MPIGMEIKRILNQLPSKVKIGKRYVGPGEPVFMIAEIGNNHNGDLELAKEMIVKAKEAGCEAVKFQKRTLDQVFTKKLSMPPITRRRLLGQRMVSIAQSLKLIVTDFLSSRCLRRSLILFSSARRSITRASNFLEDIGVDAYKIASFDVTNIPLLEDVAKRNKPIILSTGMSSMEEVDEAVETILKYNNRLVVLHCVSVYPTPDDKLDLSIIPLMKRRYAPLPIGYSGHENGFSSDVDGGFDGRACD